MTSTVPDCDHSRAIHNSNGDINQLRHRMSRKDHCKPDGVKMTPILRATWWPPEAPLPQPLSSLAPNPPRAACWWPQRGAPPRQAPAITTSSGHRGGASGWATARVWSVPHPAPPALD